MSRNLSFSNSSVDRKIITNKYAVLARLLDKRPTEQADPHRNEKHSYYIMVNLTKKGFSLT